MSVYYVIGCNQEILNLDKFNTVFDKISADDLKQYIKDVDFDKKFYYVSDALSTFLSANLNSESRVSTLETDKSVFIEFLKASKYLYEEVEVYKFSSMFNVDNNYDEINCVLGEEEINIFDSNINPEIEFDFHIRYKFITLC